MGYLDRLKQIDGEKISHDTPVPVPPKPPKAPFVSFGGTGTGHIAKKIIDAATANPTEEKTAPPPKVGTGETATASRWWLIHYPDRDPVELACCPDAPHAEILERHPAALAAEPFTPTIRQPSAPMTAEEETAIRAWLALIEETDPEAIAEVIEQCQRDADARDYFTGRAQAYMTNLITR